MKTHTHIAKAAAATAMVLLASCSMPVQVPVQTQQQQQNTQTFVDQLRKLVQGPSQNSRAYPWEEIVADPRTAPQPLPQVVWPALGAGDYRPVVIPDVLPSVIWPAPGAGDFQTTALRPIYWHTVGVDERELVPPVVAPPVNNLAPENVFAINPARESPADRAQLLIPKVAPRLTRQDVAERAAQRAVDGPNWIPPERETAYEYVIAINPAREAAAERALRVTPQTAPRLTRQDVAERLAQRAVDGP